MKKIMLALVYTALALGANPSFGQSADIKPLRDGDMKKLVVHDSPVATSSVAFQLEDDRGETTLEAWQGKYVLINFWATWCAPCRKEMPLLAELQTELGGEDFEVVTIATGKNDPAAMARFFSEIGVTNLPLHADPNSAVAREMGVLGLPATIIIARDGTEVARLLGDADWASDSAKNILKALIAAND